ncbi:hypothetical protein [Actinoplanes sp. NPDC026623]
MTKNSTTNAGRVKRAPTPAAARKAIAAGNTRAATSAAPARKAAAKR